MLRQGEKMIVLNLQFNSIQNHKDPQFYSFYHKCLAVFSLIINPFIIASCVFSLNYFSGTTIRINTRRSSFFYVFMSLSLNTANFPILASSSLSL